MPWSLQPEFEDTQTVTVTETETETKAETVPWVLGSWGLKLLYMHCFLGRGPYKFMIY